MNPSRWSIPMRARTWHCLFAVGALALAAVGGAGAASAARTDTLVTFRTPSGNIGCVFSSGAGAPTYLRCDIRSRLEPRPRRPHGCDLDWGDSYTMNRTGRVQLTCHGDTAILPHARVLHYGKHWRSHGIVCRSRSVGLRCHNHSGHGFFLSRQHSYRF
jgi:Family of unknown function (DUF6636)